MATASAAIETGGYHAEFRDTTGRGCSSENHTTIDRGTHCESGWMRTTGYGARYPDRRRSAQWAIPGSVHINAYEALRAGQPGALAAAALPRDRPVVTICNAGRVSQTAAAVLAERGFDARSLAGGMKAWSLAWNVASASR